MLLSPSLAVTYFKKPSEKTNGVFLRLMVLGLFFSALLIGGLSQTVLAQESEEEFVLNTDYTKLVKTHLQEQTDLNQLESITQIEIFYWYGCQSCYQVEMALQEYLAQHPEVTVRRTPLIARSSWRHQANLQSIMAQLSEQPNLPSLASLYQACLADCSVFDSFENNKAWLHESMQLEEFPVLDMSRLWATEKNYQKRAELFSIAQVPTIIINESYKIEANQAKTSKRMVEIADYLLTSASP